MAVITGCSKIADASSSFLDTSASFSVLHRKKNCRKVLGAAVGKLATVIGGINLAPEYIKQLVILIFSGS